MQEKSFKNFPTDFYTFSTVINRVMRISLYLWGTINKDTKKDEKTQDNRVEPHDGGRIQASGEAAAGSGARRSA